ncbi:MAG: lamin tail domain-containing protein [Patescibacteria group bacterium]|mgnify:CR=1 FL=1
MKKIIIGLTIATLFFVFKLAHAGVFINEVQLNPTAERFIELFNQSNSEVDLTNWYIQRKTSTGSSFSSLVSKTNFENKKINANGYFVISRNAIEKSDVVLSNLTLTESNIIQIKNANGEVVDKICWGDINDCSEPKISNPTEGQSAQRNQNNLLIIGAPTPGAQNYISTAVPQSSGNSSISGTGSSSAQNTTDSKIKIIEIPKIKTKILVKTLAFVGASIEFSASTTGYSNELLNYGKYFWNFGDGDSKETKASDTEKFAHTFLYEGEYTVALEYYQNYYSENPDASDKIIIKIVPADILISKIGDEKDFFVEISNNTDYDADLSKWILSSSQKSFTLPKNMILESKKKIILSPKITGLSILDKDTLKLLNPQWETVFDYSASLKPVEVLAKKSVKVSTAISTAMKPPLDGFTAKFVNEQIPSDNLEAAVVKSDTNTGTESNLMYGIGLFAFLGLSTSAAYFVRVRSRKAVVGPTGSDFEILDE